MLKKILAKKVLSVFMAFVMIFCGFASSLAQVNDDVEKYKLMGMKAIADFYDPYSSSYFGHKLTNFFDDSNLSRLKSRIESVANARGVSTEAVFKEIMCEELTDYIFRDLINELKRISEQFVADAAIKSQINLDVSKSEIAQAMAKGFGVTLGISAIVLAAFSIVTIEVTAMWSAAIVLMAGSGIGVGGVVAGIVSGPWGWVILGSIVVGTFCGYDYYMKQKQENKKKTIEKISFEVKCFRMELENKWEMLFLFK